METDNNFTETCVVEKLNRELYFVEKFTYLIALQYV